MTALERICVGDTVLRLLSSGPAQRLKVTEIDENYIYCGPWKFLKATGGEVDEDLDWDGYQTGSMVHPL